jgi:hypothetical protein
MKERGVNENVSIRVNQIRIQPSYSIDMEIKVKRNQGVLH